MGDYLDGNASGVYFDSNFNFLGFEPINGFDLKQNIASSDCTHNCISNFPKCNDGEVTITMHSKELDNKLSCLAFQSEVPMNMPKEALTYLYEKLGDLKVGVYRNGKLVKIHQIIPAVKDVKVIGDSVVIMYFADGTTEKAVLNKEDTFSLEQGISICLTKKMLSMISEDSGSSVYNKLVEHCLNVYKNNRQAEQDETQKKIADKEAAKKFKEKLDRKKARKAAEKREAQIEIQKEAYLRAMKEYNGTSAE